MGASTKRLWNVGPGALGAMFVFAALAVVVAMKLSSQADATALIDGWAAGDSLAEARHRAPYELRLPSELPDGYVLHHVGWLDHADLELSDHQASDRTIVAVDVWYQADNGSRIHVWQTNDPSVGSGEKDPVTHPRAEDHLIGSERWSRMYVPINVESPDRVELSRRYPDGVTLSIDAPLDIEPQLDHTASTITQDS